MSDRIVDVNEQFRNRPNWSLAERMDIVRTRIQQNLKGNREVQVKHHRAVDRITELTDYQTRMRLERGTWSRQFLKSEMQELGKLVNEFLKAFKETDDEDCICEIVDLLNGRFKWVRELNNRKWRNLVNDYSCEEWNTCTDCNKLEREDEGIWCYDGDFWVCSECGDDGYTYSDNRCTYINNDDYNDEENEEEDDGIIGEYHSSKRKVGHIPSEYSDYKPRVLLGLELEMEVSEDYDKSDRAEVIDSNIGYTHGTDGHQHRYCAFESDGSLDHGFEMVTGYTGLDIHAKQLAFFKKPIRGLRSHDTRTCGLHVHVCKSSMNLFHAAKLVLFVNGSDNQRLMRALARRDGSARYAQIKNKKAEYSWLKRAKGSSNPLRNLNDDRYEALNFQNENTIEFRLFKGTLRYETIMSCLEFSFMAWHFSRDVGVNELTTDHFISYISKPENRKHTRFLREYLRSKGFNIPKEAVVKANPRVVEADDKVLAEV